MKDTDYSEKVRKRRIELGLTVEEVARHAEILVEEYAFHLESEPEYIRDVYPLKVVKKLCSVLRLDLLNLLEVPCKFCQGSPRDPEYDLPRNDLISKRRRERGWSRSMLGNRIGFLEPGVANLEDDESESENWGLENLEKVATALDIPFQVLLGVSCPRCGL